MPRKWPDQRKILRYVLAPFGKTVGTLTLDWQDDVSEDTFVIHLLKVGTPDVGEDERTDRTKVDVYGIGETATVDRAEEILEFLVDHFHYAAQHEELGLIDDVQVESGPVPVGQYHAEISLVTATYRSTTRPLA